MDDELCLDGIASLEFSTSSNRSNLQRKAINSSKRYCISHSQS
jgi:hypothetical protein